MTTMTVPLPGSEGFDPEAYERRPGRHRAKTLGEKVLTLASFGHQDMIPTARNIVHRENMGDPTVDRDAESLYRLMHTPAESPEPDNANGFIDTDMTHINSPLIPKQQQPLDHPTDAGPPRR